MRCVVSLVVVALLTSSCGQPPPAPHTLRVGMPMAPMVALAIIAERQKLFDEALLDVQIVRYPSGKRSLQGMLNGEVDVSMPSDVPMAFAALRGERFRILATLCTSDTVQSIVARRDHGIAVPADLRGKRIATQKASAVHYFLHRYLIMQGMTNADIEPVYLKAEQLLPALAARDIDAYSMREPFVSQGVELLGGNAIVLTQSGCYLSTDNLVANESVPQEALETYLQGLLAAEQFLQEHPAAAKQCVAEDLGMSLQELDATWSLLTLHLDLDQILLSAQEAVADWAVEDGHVEASVDADFYDLLDWRPLEAVAPSRVTVSH